MIVGLISSVLYDSEITARMLGEPQQLPMAEASAAPPLAATEADDDIVQHIDVPEFIR